MSVLKSKECECTKRLFTVFVAMTQERTIRYDQLKAFDYNRSTFHRFSIKPFGGDAEINYEIVATRSRIIRNTSFEAMRQLNSF